MHTYHRPGKQGRATERERGQALVEFALVLPIAMFLLLIMLEVGLAFSHKLTVGYASREGARTGAALGNGGAASCSGSDPYAASAAAVDKQIIAATQRILKSPGSDIKMSDVSEIRIYKATSTGAQSGSSVNVWTYTPGAGPDIDDGATVDRLDFSQGSVGWCAGSRINVTNPDSIGVKVVYTYHLQTPLAALAQLIGGTQATTYALNDQTVMAVNPTQ
jgi:Flp pilus assembly protein TadG